MVIEFDQNIFAQEISNTDMPVLVDFWAPWCGPCKMIAPVIEEIAAEYEGKIRVGKVNVDENEPLASQYGVMSIPTLCFFHKGKLITKLIGFRPKKEIVAELTKLLSV